MLEPKTHQGPSKETSSLSTPRAEAWDKVFEVVAPRLWKSLLHAIRSDTHHWHFERLSHILSFYHWPLHLHDIGVLVCVCVFDWCGLSIVLYLSKALLASFLAHQLISVFKMNPWNKLGLTHGKYVCTLWVTVYMSCYIYIILCFKIQLTQLIICEEGEGMKHMAAS